AGLGVGFGTAVNSALAAYAALRPYSGVVVDRFTALIWSQLLPEVLVGQATVQLPPATVAATVTCVPVLIVPLIVPLVDAVARRLIESHAAAIVVVDGVGVGVGPGVGPGVGVALGRGV